MKMLDHKKKSAPKKSHSP